MNRLLVGLSILLWVLSLALIVGVGAVFVDPTLVPIPWRSAAFITPPPLPTSVPTFTATFTVTPTPTPTSTSTNTSTPTSTSTPTITPTRTQTPTPRDSATPTQTPTITRTPTETITPTPYPFRFAPQLDSLRYSPYPGGCGWMGFGGEVFDLNGHSLSSIVVRIGGPDLLVLSGSAREYGLNGWLQKVADTPTGSSSFYTLQLQDALGNALSPVVPMTTYADCNRNFIVLNFVQMNP